MYITVLLRANCCVRYPEFGGCPLFRCCYCIEHMEISVGTYSSVRYWVEVRYWECPLIESPLYTCHVSIYFMLVHVTRPLVTFDDTCPTSPGARKATLELVISEVPLFNCSAQGGGAQRIILTPRASAGVEV